MLDLVENPGSEIPTLLTMCSLRGDRWRLLIEKKVVKKGMVVYQVYQVACTCRTWLGLPGEK